MNDIVTGVFVFVFECLAASPSGPTRTLFAPPHHGHGTVRKFGDGFDPDLETIDVAFIEVQLLQTLCDI
jgi:hypothetical protein